PAIFGGVERHVEELSTRLAQRGHEVSVYVRPYYTKISGKYHEVTLRKLISLKTKHLDAISHVFLSSLDTYFRDYDIIHYHGIGPSLLSFIPKYTKAKIITTIHALDYRQKKWNTFAKWFLKLGEKWSVSFPNKTIAVSNLLKSYLENKYQKEVIYVPNGFTLQTKKKINISQKYKISKNNYILTVGRLIPDKKIHLLIKSMCQTHSKHKLVIVGDSTYTDQYAEALKLIASRYQRVVFTGTIFGEELSEIYSNAYLFILPSEQEGASISLLEAMSYGTCCLCSDIPENIELIGDCGYTFKNKDTEDLKEKLEMLLSNPYIVAEMGQKGEEYVLKTYHWENIVTKIESLYKDVLNA
ncbi:MAG: glycosyltransferase family 4 protein, partial [bacterium]|nr:glycosyltransferase family 4 protein [bacterium]